MTALPGLAILKGKENQPADAAVAFHSIFTEMGIAMNLDHQKKFLIRFSFWAIVLLLAFVILKFALDYLMPFILAILIAAILDGPICFLQKKLRLKRLLPSVFLTTLFFLAAGAIFSFLGFRLFLFIKESCLALPGLYTSLLEPTLQSIFSDLECYLSRLEPSAVSTLEDITNSFKGVDKSYAIQAGREVRIMVIPEQISDDDMVLLAREVSKRIESELEYPGQIKVNVIRESRVTDYAK